MDNSNRNVKFFFDLALKNNALINFKVVKFNNELGCTLKTDMKKGDIILKLPRKIFINSSDIILSEDCMQKFKLFFIENNYKMSLDEFRQNYGTLFLIIYFMFDKGKNVIINKYLEYIPKDISNFPTCWNDETLEIIKNTFFYKDIKSRKNKIIQLYKDICKVVEVDYDFLFFINTIISSRTFKDNTGHSIVPILDLINHSNEPNCTYEFNDENVIVRLTRDCKKDEAVMNSYGSKKKLDFLKIYGFYPNYDEEVIELSELDFNNLNNKHKNFKNYEDFSELNEIVSNFDSTLEEDIIEYNKSSNLKKLAYFIKIKEKHAILQILKESSKQ